MESSIVTPLSQRKTEEIASPDELDRLALNWEIHHSNDKFESVACWDRWGNCTYACEGSSQSCDVPTLILDTAAVCSHVHPAQTPAFSKEDLIALLGSNLDSLRLCCGHFYMSLSKSDEYEDIEDEEIEYIAADAEKAIHQITKDAVRDAAKVNDLQIQDYTSPHDFIISAKYVQTNPVQFRDQTSQFLIDQKLITYINCCDFFINLAEENNLIFETGVLS